MNLFKVAISIDRTMEDGLIKTAKELYLVDALTPGEAERRIIDELAAFATGEFNVDTITKLNSIAGVLLSDDGDAELFYQAKVAYITLDEKTGAEKTKMQSLIIQASDFGSACKRLNAEIEKCVTDIAIKSVTETKYLDLFKLKDGED